jgi:hypothetical protein
MQVAAALPSRDAVLQGGLMRRFCSCGLQNHCVCGLPRPASGWTVGRLSMLRELMREHGSMTIAAQLLGESTHNTNLALDALLGRTPTHALAVLEAKAKRS